MKHRTPIAVAVLLTGLSASFLYAKPPKEWKQPTWKVVKEQYNVIKAVDRSANTVSIHHVGGTVKVDRDLRVTTITEILVDGQKATIAELKRGMHVDYVLGADVSVAARIESREPQAPPPTPVATATPSFPKFEKKK